jgi:chemotaxis signal transduction protein
VDVHEVFKVREILVMPEVTVMVNAPPSVMGIANIRGQMIPVINLPLITGCNPSKGLGILLVTEFARTTQAFAVEEVNEIVRLEWKQVLSAEGTGGGLVTSIAVSVGQKVAKGDRLMMMEAMKMQTTVTAPVDGVVAELLCSVGETVESKDLLARLRA